MLFLYDMELKYMALDYLYEYRYQYPEIIRSILDAIQNVSDHFKNVLVNEGMMMVIVTVMLRFTKVLINLQTTTLHRIQYLRSVDSVLMLDSFIRANIYVFLQDLIDLNHHLVNSLGVGHSTLDKVREITAQFGLHSKLTGAGGGGCALTFIRDGENAEL